MSALEIRKGIYWVGGIDWNIRNFHGYSTQNGTTYNAYLVVDEKTVLIDTVKQNVTRQLISNIKQVIDPSKIDYVLSNHVEMDHSGAIPEILQYCPNATVLTSKAGEKGLRRHYKNDWNFRVVKTGDTVSTGSRTLSFITTPMVHWPDSMVTYVPEEKILFSNDAFGQHLATSERYDDEIGWSCIRKDAAKYYANIVTPFGRQAEKALNTLAEYPVEMICPSHGIVWRSYIPDILREYGKWATYETENRAVIVYDSMWNSTEKLAFQLEEGLVRSGIRCSLRNLKFTHISDVMTDLLDSRLVLLGSPTLNNGMLPTMGEFVTYLKGLKPKNRIGFAFGSYGWGGQAVRELEKVFEELDWQVPLKGTSIEYVPDESELDSAVNTGKELGDLLK